MKTRLFLSIWFFLGIAGAGSAQAASPVLSAITADGFAVPQQGHAFSFPRDYGAHPAFKLEWWYLTGHLFTKDGRRFGYQATFFRSASPDKSTQIYLAHMALIDVKSGRFYYQERLNRAGWDADAATDKLDVHNGPWSLRMTDSATAQMELHGGVRADVRFVLKLKPIKPLVAFGDDGVSRKGAEPAAASYYLTFPRLHTEGTLTVGEKTFAVAGETWMDHEISSSQLGSKQIGWDWAGVQFNDGREIMFYRLRLRDGSADPASSLTWVDAAGKQQRTGFKKWEVLARWTSPATGAIYPSRLRVTTTDPATNQETSFMLEPLVQDQELAGRLGGIPYWEGACRVLDGDDKVIGSAYLELTGYAKDLKL